MAQPVKGNLLGQINSWLMVNKREGSCFREQTLGVVVEARQSELA